MSLLTKSIVLGIRSPFTRICYQSIVGTQVRNYAARKGTRERKQKKKVKVEQQKIGFIPHNQRNKEKFLLSREKKKFDDSWKQTPSDDVYVQRYYKWRVYSFNEAIQAHQETHHADMYNQPNAPVHVSVELNMEGEKKTRFADNFSRIAAIPHKFEHGEERSIIAFTKDLQLQDQARNAGAQMVGGVELIKEIQNGAISMQDFQYCIAHPNILPELVSLRGLMKRKFPNPKSGTLDQDLARLVVKFLEGISYSALKDEYEKDFGIIETVIGTLNMEAAHLEENFASLLKDVMEARPKRPGHFISRCLIWSPPSSEKLKVDHLLYVKDAPKQKEHQTEDQDEVDAEDKQAVAV